MSDPGAKDSSDSEESRHLLPPIDFSTFVLSLASSAMVQLGEVKGPEGEAQSINCLAARQTIDILGLLEEKTQGNLSENEDKLVKSLLYDLRIKFVDAKQKSQSKTE